MTQDVAMVAEATLDSDELVIWEKRIGTEIKA